MIEINLDEVPVGIAYHKVVGVAHEGDHAVHRVDYNRGSQEWVAYRHEMVVSVVYHREMMMSVIYHHEMNHPLNYWSARTIWAEGGGNRWQAWYDGGHVTTPYQVESDENCLHYDTHALVPVLHSWVWGYFFYDLLEMKNGVLDRLDHQRGVSLDLVVVYYLEEEVPMDRGEVLYQEVVNPLGQGVVPL